MKNELVKYKNRKLTTSENCLHVLFDIIDIKYLTAVIHLYEALIQKIKHS